MSLAEYRKQAEKTKELLREALRRRPVPTETLEKIAATELRIWLLEQFKADHEMQKRFKKYMKQTWQLNVNFDFSNL